MLDPKMISDNPESVKEALKKRCKTDKEKQDSDDNIDIVCLLHHEVKLTRQAIEKAKHLQKLLEQDMHKWRRTNPELFE